MSHCPCQSCAEHLKTLGLKLPVTSEEIKAAYRDLVKVWHPDRFENDPRLRNKAEEQFKYVQAAFTALEEHRFSQPAAAEPPTSGPPPTSDPQEIDFRSLPWLSEY